MKQIDIPENIITSMIQTKVWTPECPIALEDLKLLQLKHYDFNNEIKNGQMVVNAKIAEIVLSIFQELLEIKFPIERINPIDHYQGSDELSMHDNNSSCFNFRKIAGTERLSSHSYGLAIDINPKQNPYIRIKDESTIIEPITGLEFLNRHNLRPGMLETVVPIFTTHGFIWGGKWDNPIDYHHFEYK
jgi:hypothetical protein